MGRKINRGFLLMCARMVELNCVDLSFSKSILHCCYDTVINASKIHTNGGNGRLPIQGIST